MWAALDHLDSLVTQDFLKLAGGLRIFVILMSTNARPSVVDAPEGFWRRIKLVPFRRYFALHERDVTLKERL